MKFGGKGGLRAPWREGLPPKPLAKERPNKLGGTRPRQGPSLAGRQSDGDSSRRPGSALGNPPPLIPLPTNKWEGEAAVQCLQSNRWLTMSSHETHVAAHRKPVLFAIISWAGEAHRPRRPNPFRRVPCDGPTGSKEAANCAADCTTPPPVCLLYHTGQGCACFAYAAPLRVTRCAAPISNIN